MYEINCKKMRMFKRRNEYDWKLQWKMGKNKINQMKGKRALNRN